MAETWEGKDGGTGDGESEGVCAPASGNPAASKTATAAVERNQASVYWR
jgi:hypothetical protein